MKLFRVIFEHNKAISAVEVDFSNHTGIKIGFENGRKTIQGMTIFADDVQDALETANEMENGILSRKTNV